MLRRSINEFHPTKDKFSYLLVIDDEPNTDDNHMFSPFQNFSKGVQAISPCLITIAELPASTYEFFIDKNEIIKTRTKMKSVKEIFAIGKNSLWILDEISYSDFIVIFFPQDRGREIAAWQKRVKGKVLGCCYSSEKPIWGVPVQQLTRNFLYEYFIAHNHHRKFPKRKKLARTKLPLKFYDHGVYLPSFISLLEMNYKGKTIQGHFAYDTTSTKKTIAQYATQIRSIRQKLKVDARGIDLIISSPSLQRAFYRLKNKKRFDPSIVAALNALIKQDKFIIQIEASVDGEIHSAFKMLLSIRAKEQFCYNAILSVYASNYFSPVLRLTPMVNLINEELTNFSMCARGQSVHRSIKLERLRKKISTKIRKALGTDYLKKINETRGHVKIFADLPLELIDVRGIPLSIRFPTSRLPVGSGNTLLTSALSTHPIQLNRDELKDILVLRSFQPNDPLRTTFETAITYYNRKAKDINFRFVDVETTDEFVSTINSSSEKILVYDGHGFVNNETGISMLKIGKENFDPAQHQHTMNTPPIVILSACDTLPTDTSHMAVANAFLTAGAKTVLGTLTPVDGVSSAIFVTRLVSRVGSFLETVLSFSNITWADIVHGAMQMQYCTEFIMWFCQIFSIKDVKFKAKIQLYANMYINPPDEGWYENFLNYLSEQSGVPLEAILKEMDKRFFYCEVTSYTQIGSPELISIY